MYHTLRHTRTHRTLLCAPVYSIYGLSLAFFVLYLCIITLAIEGSELNQMLNIVAAVRSDLTS